MTDVKLADKDIIDFNGRDKCRTPMQWDNTTNAGFSSANKTWLPLATSYKQVNVALQRAKVGSHLNVFQKLGELRKKSTMKYGTLQTQVLNNNVLAYKRQINGEADVVVIVLNFGSTSKIVDISIAIDGLPNQMETYVASGNSQIE